MKLVAMVVKNKEVDICATTDIMTTTTVVQLKYVLKKSPIKCTLITTDDQNVSLYSWKQIIDAGHCYICFNFAAFYTNLINNIIII